MKLIITGSMGLVGSKLMQEAKKRQHKVLGIDKKAGFGLNNITQLNQVIMKQLRDWQIIIHLAGTSSTLGGLNNPGGAFADNVVSTFNVCEIARLYNRPIHYTSTCKVEPNKEGMFTPYGLFKLMGEMMVKEYRHSFGLPYVINRPGTIYGPGQEASAESGWLGWFVKAATLKEPLTIFGDGKQTRDVLYVDDYVRLVLDQVEKIEKYEGKTFDVGGGPENEVSLLQVLKHLEYKNYNFGKPRVGDVKRYASDNKEVSAVTGWKPKVGWRTGIKKVVEYYKKLNGEKGGQSEAGSIVRKPPVQPSN